LALQWLSSAEKHAIPRDEVVYAILDALPATTPTLYGAQAAASGRAVMEATGVDTDALAAYLTAN
jgi:hypothetical protein